MQYDPTVPVMKTPSIETSLRTGHIAASRAERILSDLLDRLSGVNGANGACGTEAACGIAEDARSLSERINEVADLADRVASRVLAAPPVELQSAAPGGSRTLAKGLGY